MSISLIPSDIRHPNVVQFFGVSTKDDMIVTEYLGGGSLRDYMMNRSRIFTVEEILSLMIGPCSALVYLHSLSPPIYHGDLHDKNLVLTRSNTPICKICDFGLSLISPTPSRNIYKAIKPPELGKTDSIYTSESDVFSFGVILYKLFCYQRLHDHITSEFVLVPEGDMLNRHKYEPDTTIQFLKIIRQCVAEDPKQRVKIRNLLARLGALKKELEAVSNTSQLSIAPLPVAMTTSPVMDEDVGYVE